MGCQNLSKWALPRHNTKLYSLDVLVLSNHNIHKSLCSYCFWASDPLIDRFYWNLSIKGSEAPKQKPHKLLWILNLEFVNIYFTYSNDSPTKTLWYTNDLYLLAVEKCSCLPKSHYHLAILNRNAREPLLAISAFTWKIKPKNFL